MPPQKPVRIDLSRFGQFDPVPQGRSLLKAPPQGKRSKPAPDLRNPLGVPLSVERDPYARPLGEDIVADVADFVSGATFGDGLGPDASRAETLGLAATAGLTPGMLAKSGRGLFSKLVEGFKTTLPAKVKADSLVNLAKKVGAKDEEILHVGLRELAEGNRGRTLPREEVIAAIEARVPKVETTVLGAPSGQPLQWRSAPDGSDIADYGGGHFKIYRVDGGLYDGQWTLESPSGYVRRFASREEALAKANSAPKQYAVTPTKFSQHTLPGGENYRETLITLPENTPQPSGRYRIIAYDKDGNAVVTMQSGGENDLERLRARWEPEGGRVSAAPLLKPAEGNFTSGHFDTPNVLTHIRHNDRVTPSGERVRFLEEVQSDWHQKGKEGGYQQIQPDDVDTGRMIQAHLDKLNHEMWEIETIYRRLYARGASPREVDEASARYASFAQERDKWDRQLEEIEARRQGAVPDAPFKDSWPDLALKQQLLDASERGLDGIAWTPGSVQADRYDLSKQLDGLNIERIGGPGEPMYVVHGQTTSGRTIDFGAVEASKLPDVIGKEMAERIVGNPEKVQQYRGLDLQVGGEGMHAFYDQLLPKRMEKLLKPFGGRVERANLDVTEGPLPNYAIVRQGDFYGIENAAGEAVHSGAATHEDAMRVMAERFGPAMVPKVANARTRGFDPRDVGASPAAFALASTVTLV